METIWATGWLTQPRKSKLCASKSLLSSFSSLEKQNAPLRYSDILSSDFDLGATQLPWADSR
ncbi:MAG: hypothetical protein ACPGU4_08795 [Flavobacteriales bacterium]